MLSPRSSHLCTLYTPVWLPRGISRDGKLFPLSLFLLSLCVLGRSSRLPSLALCPFSLLGTLGEGHSLSSPLSLLQAATQTAKSTLSTKTATHGLQLRKVEIQQAIIYQKWLTNGQL